VSVEGPLDEQTGMVIDLKDLKDVLESEVGARFDHRCLNDDTAFFRDRPPTAENLAAAIFELLDRALPGRMLRRVRLSPTPELWVEVER
jgi:6-pyruvoyltetrahydropterin/6-carboxytetrahydropterin synthase